MDRATSDSVVGRLATGLCALLFSAAASAVFVPVAQPDATYLSATSRLDFLEPDFDVVPSLTDGVQTVTFDLDLVALTVPDTWGTWGSPPDTELATPRVLWTNGDTALQMDLSLPALLFGFEAQPNVGDLFDITADFFSAGNLVGSITLSVDGNAGARLFAAANTDPFDQIVLSSQADFAIANVRYATQVIPEPGSAALVLSAMLSGGLIVALRRRRPEGTCRDPAGA